VHISDKSVFNCRANIRGECAGFESSLLSLLNLFKTIIILK